MEYSMKSSVETRADASSGIMGTDYVGKYRFFRELLDHNRRSLTLMADPEETYYANRPVTSQQIMAHCVSLQEEVPATIQCLKELSGKDRLTLSPVLASIQRSVRNELTPRSIDETESYVGIGIRKDSNEYPNSLASP